MKTAKLTDRGKSDYAKGLPIDAFYQVKGIRHTEINRGTYENGWRYAKDQDRKHGGTEPRNLRENAEVSHPTKED